MKRKVMHIGEVESAKLLETMSAVAYTRGYRDGERAVVCGVIGASALISLAMPIVVYVYETRINKKKKSKDKKES